MPNLMKNRYNYNTIHKLAMYVNAVYPTFQADDFIADVMDETWDTLELKARMRRITINLGKYLPSDYEYALRILDKAIADYPVGNVDSGLLYFPDFVEVYGQDERYWDLSMTALEPQPGNIHRLSQRQYRPYLSYHELLLQRRPPRDLEHPAIGLSVRVYGGTGSTPLSRGAGHFLVVRLIYSV